MKKTILLVSYVFPPYPGVGGRRWAKFARYLAEAGYDVHVICAENPMKEESVWMSDTQHPSIHVHALPAKYPRVLNSQPKTVAEKLSYRAWQWIFKAFSKGSQYERSLFWKKQLHREAIALVQRHGIKNVIVTGPPFLLLHHVVTLKEKLPGLRVIVDIRDPWTDNKSFMGFSTMAPQRLAFERKTEQEVLERADVVLTVADYMSRQLRDKLATKKEKVVTLTNGYDPKEIRLVTQAPAATDRSVMRFVYAGSLYPNLGYVLGPFTDHLVQLRNEQPELYHRLRFEFYGYFALEPRGLFESKGLTDIASFHGWVSAPVIEQKILEADCCLLVFAADHAFSLNTKLFEYLARRKPVLLLSGPGETPAFLEENQLGIHAAPGTIAQKFPELVQAHFNGTLHVNTQFDLSAFSIPALGKKLEALLEEPDASH